MHHLRAFSAKHRHLAMVLLALALLMKAAIPAGYMVTTAKDMVLSVTVCTDGMGPQQTVDIVIPAKNGQNSQRGADNGKSGHCAFSGLGKTALGGADPVLLALAFAFILVLGLAPVRRLPFRRIANLLPPQCGPPARSAL